MDLDSADHTGSRAVNISGTPEAENDRDLAQLVWKYFGEEISETLKEVQATLAPHKYGSNNT